MKTLNAAVIGLGVGERHVVAYQSMPHVEVRAICDLDPVRLREVGCRRGIARRETEARRLTEDPEIDVISVCSYDDAHAEQAISAFRHGKHVFVEKPLALHRADAEAILRAQQDSGCKLSSNLILRRSPRFAELKRQIESGDLGEIICIEGDYIHPILPKIVDGWRGRMPFYCVTYGGGVHLIDLMRWLTGDEIVEICGMGSQMLTAGTQFKYPDTLVHLLRFRGGTLGKTLTLFGPTRPKFHALNVYGTRRTFINDLPWAKLFDGEDPRGERRVETPYPGMEKGDLLPDFVTAIREGREPLVSARDVFRVMDVCYAAWESVQQGRTVNVSYLI